MAVYKGIRWYSTGWLSNIRSFPRKVLFSVEPSVPCSSGIVPMPQKTLEAVGITYLFLHKELPQTFLWLEATNISNLTFSGSGSAKWLRVSHEAASCHQGSTNLQPEERRSGSKLTRRNLSKKLLPPVLPLGLLVLCLPLYL